MFIRSMMTQTKKEKGGTNLKSNKMILRIRLKLKKIKTKREELMLTITIFIYKERENMSVTNSIFNTVYYFCFHFYFI